MAKGPEAELQRKVLSIAKLYGWEWYHPPAVDPRRVGGTPYKPGWLDLTLAKEAVGRMLFVELKADGNYPTPEQRAWMRRHDAAGNEVGLWYPRDLDTVKLVLGPRQQRLVLPDRYRYKPVA